MSVGLGPYIWQGIELQSWRVNPGPPSWSGCSACKVAEILGVWKRGVPPS
jgi:hypothetical protein